jgi:hypothetical protein
LVLLTPFYIPVFLGVDLWTGGAFECPDQIKPQSNPVVTPIFNDVAYCRQILIVPPSKLRKDEAIVALNAWVEKNHDQLTGCDRFLDRDKTMALLSVLNFRFGEVFDISKMPPAGAHEIANYSGATHVVSLDVDPQKSGISKITYKILDLIASDKGRDSLDFEDATVNVAYEDTAYQRFRNRFSLDVDMFLPNGAAWGYNFRTPLKSQISANNAGRIADLIESKNQIPNYLSNLMYTTVSHPYGHPDWSFSFDLVPAAEFIWSNYTVTVRDNDMGSHTEDVEVQNLILAYRFGLTSYTPIVAFSASLGPGLNIIRSDADTSDEKYDVFRSISVALAATKFISSKVFFQTGFETTMSVDAKLVEFKYHRLTPVVISQFARVGVFLPVANHFHD